MPIAGKKGTGEIFDRQNAMIIPAARHESPKRIRATLYGNSAKGSKKASTYPGNGVGLTKKELISADVGLIDPPRLTSQVLSGSTR